MIRMVGCVYIGCKSDCMRIDDDVDEYDARERYDEGEYDRYINMIKNENPQESDFWIEHCYIPYDEDKDEFDYESEDMSWTWPEPRMRS